MTWAVPPKHLYCKKVKYSQGNHPEDWTCSTGCDWTMTYSWTHNCCCEINHWSSYYVRAANAPDMWERCCFIHLRMGGVTKESPRNNSSHLNIEQRLSFSLIWNKHRGHYQSSQLSDETALICVPVSDNCNNGCSVGKRLISQKEEVTVMRKRSTSQTRKLYIRWQLWAVSVWTPLCSNGHVNVQGLTV